MAVYKLTIEYDGTDYSGWQIQQGQRTVQGELTTALATILRSHHGIQGASRTDAGVHATGQVASFETEQTIEPQRLVRGLSALCRPGIAVVSAEVVPDGFNARFDSQGKHYIYRILGRSAPSPLMGRTSWHVSQRLDVTFMKQAASSFIGTHDFKGFRSADCGRENTFRTLSCVDIVKESLGMISIHVKGTAFLKNMVRIIAGTLVDVGRGALPPDVVPHVLASGNRSLAGQTAPACGLTLAQVFYPNGWIRQRG